jgi:hypothetical protein
LVALTIRENGAGVVRIVGVAASQDPLVTVIATVALPLIWARFVKVCCVPASIDRGMGFGATEIDVPDTLNVTGKGVPLVPNPVPWGIKFAW